MMKPKGFWSYTRGDDEHLDGVLTRLRARLEGEVSSLLGYDVDIFQDIRDITVGDRWADKLRGELTQASFLIPVLTPRYFNRDWCREETLTFLRLAEEQGHVPLVFPILFIDYDKEEDCEVRAALAPYQYEDFSQWRFESDPTAQARLEHGFARDVKDKLKLPKRPKPKAGYAPPEPSKVAEVQETQRLYTPELKPVIEELTVDPWPGRADHTSIKAAMKAAPAGARLLIRPGTYAENLVLDKPLELIGEGVRDAVQVAANSGIAMDVTASVGLVRNMRFLREEGEGENVALWVSAGRCAFEDCSFTSRTHVAIGTQGSGTAPSFLRCRFDLSRQSGTLVWEQSTPRFEACRFTNNGFHGIAISSHANPTLDRCLFQSNQQHGAFVYDEGRGRFTACDFSKNNYDGVATKGGASPQLVDCTLSENRLFGFRAEDAEGGGTLERCTLKGNALRNWGFAGGSEKNVTRIDCIEE